VGRNAAELSSGGGGQNYPRPFPAAGVINFLPKRSYAVSYAEKVEATKWLSIFIVAYAIQNFTVKL